MTRELLIIGTLLVLQHLIKNKIKMYNFEAKLKYEDECFGLSFCGLGSSLTTQNPTSNNFAFYLALRK